MPCTRSRLGCTARLAPPPGARPRARGPAERTLRAGARRARRAQDPGVPGPGPQEWAPGRAVSSEQSRRQRRRRRREARAVSEGAASERAPPRVRSAGPPWPGARSRLRVGGIELYWAGTRPRAGVRSKDAEGARDPGPSLRGAGRAGGIPRASRRDATRPARESWRSTPGAAPAEPRDPREGRGEPTPVQRAVPGPAECTISGDGGGPARGRGPGALARSRWGGGALLPWGGARLETRANFPQVTLLRRLQRLTSRPCSALVASGPLLMMGFSFLLVLKLVCQVLSGIRSPFAVEIDI